MAARLCFAVCQGFHAEVAAAIVAEGWDDVDSIAFPARCGRPPLDAAALRAALPAGCTQLRVLGGACTSGLPDVAVARPAGRSSDGPELPTLTPTPALRVRPLAQCFHLVAGPAQVAAALADGAYLLTPAWLADWPARLAELGYAPEGAAALFQEFARELLLLDTGSDPAASAQLPALAAALGLPARRVTVGLDSTRALLAREVLQWRLDEAQAAARAQAEAHARELADHVAALDVLGRLAPGQTEAAAIAAVEDLLRMLFAPRAVHYLRVNNGVDLPEAPLPPAVQAALAALCAPWAWTAEGDGFLLRIGRDDAVVGKVAVLGLAYPAQRERYLNMALALTGACSLAIENARIRARLLQAEKLASLSIVVAGVAHEINTPLGVDLVAVSALQDATRRLAQRFAERQMTQSELQAYLARTGETTALVRSNLERIGTLVDTFRQAAVGGPAPPPAPVRLRGCLDAVLRSLGDALAQAGVVLHIACDPALQIDSHAGDWASVFTNLIGNSLQHGFKGRAKGRIDIGVTADAALLRIDYRDDGRGMAADTRARVFDPFFTTELQHGMGLGMHLVYNLVTQRFGGRIHCDSQPGRGVHFHIEVPR